MTSRPAGRVNGAPSFVFWAASLVIHAFTLCLFTSVSWFPHSPVEKDVITAGFMSPGAMPALESPPPPPKSKSLPDARPHFMPARATVSAPSFSISMPRFVVTAVSAPLWTFWLPANLAVAQNAPPSPSVAAEPSDPSAAAESSGMPATIGSQVGASGKAGGSFAIPAYWQTPLPVYPALAKAHHWEGVTLLRIEVLVDGRVGRVELAHSSGHQMLDESAIKAVHRWRFHPAKLGGTPITCFINVPVRFKLDDART